MALLMHSISWSTMIMFPILFHNFFIITYKFLFMWLFNVVIHFITDNEKANNKSINLIQDQLIHMIQIVLKYFRQNNTQVFLCKKKNRYSLFLT